jgi:CubicO group peptidase (beta-lactamase class C family)
MRRRLLAVCLLAYPRSRREVDGDYLLDLALELADESGTRRQAVSLVGGGLLQRVRVLRRGPVLLAGGVLAATLAVGGAAGAAEEVEVETSVGTFLDQTLPAGASGTLVAVRGRTVVCEGFGWADRRARVAADCDTVYDVGSITKQFTAAAVLKLEMLGKLDVHDPVSRFLGPVPADKAGITVQQLLTHTAGLVDALGGDYEPLTRRQLVAEAMASPLRSAPGAEYHYSNVGYSLLAAIVREASGTGYERFLATHLFAPAGMTRTGYVLPRWRRADVAVEYDARGRPQGRPFDHPWAATGPWWNLRGNGGMLSTARDLVRWHRSLQHATVLDRRAQRELFRPRVLEEPGGDSRYGYGWVLLDTVLGRVAWHNGGNGWSYGEVARVLGRGQLVFWVTNRVRNDEAGWDLERLGSTLTSGVLRRLADRL